uniref:Uncharacterized protein n=1 Tax=Panagrolaimus davidi TaxID=227884 RepID=A0A914QC77_9BILA
MFPSLNSLIFKCREIDLRGLKLYPKEFLQLLSIKVRYIECTCVKLQSTLKFSEILKAAPNVEVMKFRHTNIETDNSWPEEILKWKTGGKLSWLQIPIQETNFNVERLVDVIEVRKN